MIYFKNKKQHKNKTTMKKLLLLLITATMVFSCNKAKEESILRVQEGYYAFCGASGAVPTGKKMMVQGVEFDEGCAICPVFKGPSIANLAMEGVSPSWGEVIGTKGEFSTKNDSYYPKNDGSTEWNEKYVWSYYWYFSPTDTIPQFNPKTKSWEWMEPNNYSFTVDLDSPSTSMSNMFAMPGIIIDTLDNGIVLAKIYGPLNEAAVPLRKAIPVTSGMKSITAAIPGKPYPVGTPVPASDLSKKIINTPLVNTTYDVEFDVDYNSECQGQGSQSNPIVSTGGVNFGNKDKVLAGRVCSKNGYINISKIEADIDLSALAQRSDFSGDWLNAAFYAVSSKVQPIKADYCDAEYEAVGFCQEIDFLETNGQKLFQHTLHLADAKKGDQSYEFSYTEAANTDCWEWDEMQAAAGTAGVTSLVGKIDPNKPFHMIVTFPSDYTNMIITLSQDGGDPITVFNYTSPAYPGSNKLDMSKLKDAMAVGWWFTPSYHNAWSPGACESGGSCDPVWYKDTGDCGHGSLCGAGGGWKLANLKVTAESKI